MNQLTTRELLYLEDMSKMFESISKNCDFASSAAVDPQLKSLLQSISQERKQWISATSSIVNGSKLQ